MNGGSSGRSLARQPRAHARTVGWSSSRCRLSRKGPGSSPARKRPSTKLSSPVTVRRSIALPPVCACGKSAARRATRASRCSVLPQWVATVSYLTRRQASKSASPSHSVQPSQATSVGSARRDVHVGRDSAAGCRELLRILALEAAEVGEAALHVHGRQQHVGRATRQLLQRPPDHALREGAGEVGAQVMDARDRALGRLLLARERRPKGVTSGRRHGTALLRRAVITVAAVTSTAVTVAPV